MAQAASTELAINGGPKACNGPWPSRRLFGAEEKRAADALFDRAIGSGQAFGYNGEEEEAYCREFAEFLGGGYADAVNSGTSAIYVALRALETEPFTEVVVPPITDPGGVMPVPLLNCIPVVADSAPDSYNAGPDQIEERITERTSAIIVAHIAGLPAEMGPILEVAGARGIPVIEDCAQAHGPTYKGRPVGTFGEIGAFSTMSGKHHATGAQGGVAFTRDEDVYWRCRRASDRGKPFGLEGAESNVLASLNLNLNDLSAAIGRVQLRKLPRMVQSRRRLASHIAERCRGLHTVRLKEGLPEGDGVFWFLLFKLGLSRLSVGKEDFVKALAAEGLPVGPSYLHLFTRAQWYRDRAVFGRSGYPWTCPLYEGDPDAEYGTPNILATDACHFMMSFHENLGEQDVGDIHGALAKVERAYMV